VRGGWQLASACLFGLFAVALFAALEFPLLDELGPGPGFFPFWLSLAGGVLAVLLFLEVTRDPALAADDTAVLPVGGGAVRVMAVLGSLVVAAAVIEPLGYRLTTFFFIGGLLIFLGVRSPLALVPCALLGSFGVFHVFYHWLKVPLPVGWFGV
jgi:putative tricarboxylic transport membrane protein